MAVVSPVQTEDLVGVRSRISWGAIIAGSVLAISVYFLLSLLGGAVGFSISGSTDTRTLTISAIVWAIVSTAMSLFIGGYVASLLTVGENKNEAALYGLLVWAVVFTMLMWLMVSGVKTGFNALVSFTTMGTSVADTTARNSTQADWEETARRAGFDQKQIDEVKQRAKEAPAQVRQQLEDPATKQKADALAKEAGQSTTKVMWYTFAGTLLTMITAIAGGFAGAGPSLRIILTGVPVATPRPSGLVQH